MRFSLRKATTMAESIQYLFHAYTKQKEITLSRTGFKTMDGAIEDAVELMREPNEYHYCKVFRATMVRKRGVGVAMKDITFVRLVNGAPQSQRKGKECLRPDCNQLREKYSRYCKYHGQLNPSYP